MISEKIRTTQGMEGARRATGIPCAGTAAQGTHSIFYYDMKLNLIKGFVPRVV